MMIHATLGVISSDPLLRADLVAFAGEFGFTLGPNVAPDAWHTVDASKLPDVDCWLVDEQFFEHEYEEVESFLEESERPVIYGLNSFNREPDVRRREFISLLKKLMAHIRDGEEELQELWILGASLGGPEAVKEFLDALPEGLPVAFMYAQHLDEANAKILTDVIGRDAKIPVVGIQGVTALQKGIVYKVPVDQSIDFVQGACFKTGMPWTGQYTPSIEELLRRAAHIYGARAHVIYFSGMGEDGALVATEMNRRGSTVWAQSTQSAVSSAMPESVISKRICERIASPRDLAVLLAGRLKENGQIEPNAN